MYMDEIKSLIVDANEFLDNSELLEMQINKIIERINGCTDEEFEQVKQLIDSEYKGDKEAFKQTLEEARSLTSDIDDTITNDSYDDLVKSVEEMVKNERTLIIANLCQEEIDGEKNKQIIDQIINTTYAAITTLKTSIERQEIHKKHAEIHIAAEYFYHIKQIISEAKTKRDLKNVDLIIANLTVDEIKLKLEGFLAQKTKEIEAKIQEEQAGEPQQSNPQVHVARSVRPDPSRNPNGRKPARIKVPVKPIGGQTTGGTTTGGTTTGGTTTGGQTTGGTTTGGTTTGGQTTGGVQIGQEERIIEVKIKHKEPKKTWKTVLAVAAGLGIGVGAFFVPAMGPGSCAVTAVGGLIAKNRLHKKRREMAEQEILNPNQSAQVQNITQPTGLISKAIFKLKQYLKSDEGLRDMEWLASAATISSAGMAVGTGVFSIMSFTALPEAWALTGGVAAGGVTAGITQRIVNRGGICTTVQVPEGMSKQEIAAMYGVDEDQVILPNEQHRRVR